MFSSCYWNVCIGAGIDVQSLPHDTCSILRSLGVYLHDIGVRSVCSCVEENSPILILTLFICNTPPNRVVIFLSMSLQNTLLDTAATDMAYTFQRTYFSLLLQQDTAYFDLTDVAGTAQMIGTQGAKFKKGIGRKLGEGERRVLKMVQLQLIDLTHPLS